MLHCIFSHINRRTQFENPVLEAKRRLEQQRQMQSQGLSALPLPTIYRGTHGILHCAVMSKRADIVTQLHKSENARTTDRACALHGLGHVQIDLKHFQILPVEKICIQPTSVVVHGVFVLFS